MDGSYMISKGGEDILSGHTSTDSEADKKVARFWFLEITWWRVGVHHLITEKVEVWN